MKTDGTSVALPRPLRSDQLLLVLRAVDAQHEQLGADGHGQGRLKLEVHYPPSGAPAVASVCTTLNGVRTTIVVPLVENEIPKF